MSKWHETSINLGNAIIALEVLQTLACMSISHEGYCTFENCNSRTVKTPDDEPKSAQEPLQGLFWRTGSSQGALQRRWEYCAEEGSCLGSYWTSFRDFQYLLCDMIMHANLRNTSHAMYAFPALMIVFPFVHVCRILKYVSCNLLIKFKNVTGHCLLCLQ